MEPFTMMALAGAGLGALKGMQNQKRMKEHNKYRKAAMAYSPWTGMSDPGEMNLPGVFESALQMGATGAMLGSMIPGGEAAAAGGAAASGGAGAGALGGTEMAAKLGTQGSNFLATMPAAAGGTAANTGMWSGMAGAGSAGALGGSQALMMPTLGMGLMRQPQDPYGLGMEY